MRSTLHDLRHATGFLAISVVALALLGCDPSSSPSSSKPTETTETTEATETSSPSSSPDDSGSTAKEATDGGDPAGAERRSAAMELDRQVEALWRAGQGESEEILSLAERAVAARRELPVAPELGGSLVNLATLLLVRARYEEAKPLLEEALEVYERLSHEADPPPDLDRRRANCLNSLGGVYHRLGDYPRARECFEEAAQLRETIPDPSRAALTSTLINLALLLTDMQEWSDARETFERAQTLWDRPQYENDVVRASGMNNFAWLLFQLGEVEAATRLFEKALALRREALPADHPHTAWTLHNLGVIHLSRGELQSAEPYLDEALGIREKAFSRLHPLRAHSLREKALLLLARGDLERAIETSQRAESIALRHLDLQIAALNEQTALRFAASRYASLDVLLSAFVQLGASEQAKHRDTAFRQAAGARASVLDRIALRRRASRHIATDDEEMAQGRRELDAVTAELAQASLTGDDARVEELTRKREQAEEALARRSGGRTQRTDAIEMSTLRNALPTGSALVAYTRYQRFEVGEDGAPQARPAYLAFVVRQEADDVEALPLGSAAEIEAKVARWREELLAVLSVATDDEKAQAQAEQALLATGHELRAAIWDPVETAVGKAKLILVVPDGTLHAVSFAVLPDEAATAERPRYLVENERRWHRLTAERDILSFAAGANPGDARERPETLRLLAVGDVDFGDTESDSPLGAPLRPLPATRREVEAVAALWKEARPSSSARVLLEEAATETAVREQAGEASFVHLATHGFFLASTQAVGSGAVRTRSVGVAPAREDAGATRIENPLLLCGLAFAGANTASRTTDARNDGLLTADEVSALDLDGAQWVVLSACDTGRGAIQEGEGVLGLDRAFRAAGARTLILSLWPVEDASTQEWMRALYEKRWRDGAATPDCLRSASLSLLKGRRDSGKSTHPFFWGAFVSSGDWR